MAQKLKTCKAAAKRFSLTARGIKRRKAGLNHRITGKGKSTRTDKGGIMMSAKQVYILKKLMPGV